MSNRRKRKLDKSTLAQTFRFDCDRFLRFRLATDEERERAGFSDARFTRPGLEEIRAAGRRWETDQYDSLVRAFDGSRERVHYRRDEAIDTRTQRKPFLSMQDFFDRLRQSSPPVLIVEGEFSLPASAVPGLQEAFERFNLDPVRMRPDILWIRPAGESRAPLIGASAEEVEYEIHVIDVKLVSEPNLRHFTEVTYYALALAEALKIENLASRYAVSAQGYIWPGSYVPNLFRDLMAENRLDPDPLASTLERILVAVPYEIYQFHVRDFFQDRLLPVLGTDVLETAWHVQPSCALCDYLKFCGDQAKRDDHLSRVAWLTRGQSETLRRRGINTTTALAGAIQGNSTAWQEATASNQQLRASAPALLARTQALLSGQPVLAIGRRVASMPRSANLNIFLTIHSDPGSGLVFAMGADRVYWKPGDALGTPPQRDRTAKVFIVDSAGDFKRDAVMRLDAERQRLVEFLAQIGQWLDEVERDNQALRDAHQAAGGSGRVRGLASAHFFVWDSFEIKQLRRLIERHLADEEVRDKVGLLLRFFPPDSMLPTDPDAYRSQPGTAVKDVFKLLVGVPVAHDYTLLEVVNNFYPRRGIDGQFYVHKIAYGFYTPLTDQIPFERAYELWTGNIYLKKYDPEPARRLPFSRDEIRGELVKTVGTRLQALDELVQRLRTNYRDQLTLKKAPFSAAQPARMRVPVAGQQLNALERLDEAAREIENRATRALPVEEREARYKAMRGLRPVPESEFRRELEAARASNPRYQTAELFVFTFPLSSADARIEQGDFTLALSNEAHPSDAAAPAFDLDLPWARLLEIEWGSAEQAVLRAGLPRYLAFLPLRELVRVEAVRIEAGRGTRPPFIILAPRNPSSFDFAVRQRLLNMDEPLVLDPVHVDFALDQIRQVLYAVGSPPVSRAPRARRR